MTDEELAAQKAEEEKLAREKEELEAKKKADEEASKKKSEEENKKPSDAEAKLLKELMKMKSERKAAEEKAKALEEKYSGFDLDALLEAAKKAEEAERAELERKGDYERLIAKQKEAHAKELEALKTQAEEARRAAEAAQKAQEMSTVSNAFSNSRYVLDNLTLTPNKTKALYGSYFELEDGKIVGYDKPRGEAGRTKIVDGAGEPVSFDEAMKQIVESDPDKESLIKSNLGAGAGSEPNSGKFKMTEKKKPLSSMDKILEGLKEQKLI